MSLLGKSRARYTVCDVVPEQAAGVELDPLLDASGAAPGQLERSGADGGEVAPDTQSWIATDARAVFAPPVSPSCEAASGGHAETSAHASVAPRRARARLAVAVAFGAFALLLAGLADTLLGASRSGRSPSTRIHPRAATRIAVAPHGPDRSAFRAHAPRAPTRAASPRRRSQSPTSRAGAARRAASDQSGPRSAGFSEGGEIDRPAPAAGALPVLDSAGSSCACSVAVEEFGFER
ncbi:MAG: hypothetical protein ACYCSI_06690 [Solirubrobacteraceae bacterium]